MHSEMDYCYYYGHPFTIHHFLEACDIPLVKQALYLILHPAVENATATPESIQINDALINYITQFNNAFLASERIRAFLLLSLLASLIISFISLTTLPITATSVTLICVVSFLLFSVNIFTLFNQITGYQQEIDWKKLKADCSEYTKKLYLGKLKQSLTNTLGQTSSPTSTPCLFPARKIPQNDEFTRNSDENPLNNDSRLSPIDENAYENSIKSNENSHLSSLTI